MNGCGLVRERWLECLQSSEDTEIRAEVVDLADFHAVTRVVGEYLTFACIDQTTGFAGRGPRVEFGQVLRHRRDLPGFYRIPPPLLHFPVARLASATQRSRTARIRIRGRRPSGPQTRHAARARHL